MAAFVLIFVAAITALIVGYIWQAGLDLRSAVSVKDYLGLCSRGREDMYCKAARRLTKEINGPIVFIHPNKGDGELTADILRATSQKGMTLDRIVASNIFVTDKLVTGVISSLNGDLKTANCTQKDGRSTCLIDGLTISIRDDFGSRGAVYSSLAMPQSDRNSDFLLPNP